MSFMRRALPTPSRRKSLGGTSTPEPHSTAQEAAYEWQNLSQSTIDASSPDASTDAVFKVPVKKAPSHLRSQTPVGTPRKSAAFTDSTNAQQPQVGDKVTALQFHGVLRYLGPVGDKPGLFGGIELTGDFVGLGKNDGSVDGVQYFACDVHNGIFAPLSKIAVLPSTKTSLNISLPRPPSTTPQRLNSRAKTSSDAARAAEAKITQGSRASRYLNMTADQLQQAGRTTPSRNISSSSAASQPSSPDKLSKSVNATPKAKGRASLGVTPTASSARKSLGGSTSATPKSLKRPSSRISNAGAPEVPAIPSNYTRSITPSQRFFDARESSTPRPGTPARSVSRSSQASESSRRASGIGLGRPLSRASAYERPASRSEARPISRQSLVSQDLETLEGEKLQAIKSAEDARMAQIDAEKALKQSQARFEEMHLRMMDLESQLKMVNADNRLRASKSSDQADSEKKAQDRIIELETQLRKANEQSSELFNRIETELQVERQAKEQAISQASTAAHAQLQDSAREKADLEAQVEQLREAGQALCGVYEERLAEIEADRRGLADSVARLEEQLASAQVNLKSPEQVQIPQTPTALSIDNENLRLELDHAKNKVHMLEEQLAESRHSLESELLDVKRRKSEWLELENGLRKDISLYQQNSERSSQAEQRSINKLTELEAALQESKTALEKERNEIEKLRKGHADSKELQAKVSSLQTQADELNEEIGLLEEIKVEHMNMQTESSASAKALQDEIAILKTESARKDEKIASLQRETASLNVITSPILGSRRGSGASILVSEDEQKTMRDQIVGLKVIVNQLTEENREYGEQNKLLLNQAQALKDAQRILEGTVESLMAQMEMEQDQASDNQESPSLRRSTKGSAPPVSSNDLVEKELRKQITDVERRKNREIANLNQEVSELEHLVEAKIFKEDELESMLKKYKRLLEEAEKQGFKFAEAEIASKSSKSSESQHSNTDEDACELCGDKGHELTDCPVMGITTDGQGGKDYCEDCDAYGHVTSRCPLANEIF